MYTRDGCHLCEETRDVLQAALEAREARAVELVAFVRLEPQNRDGRTSATFFVANSPASGVTSLPITSALTELEVSLAICWAAARVSKLVLFHLP